MQPDEDTLKRIAKLAVGEHFLADPAADLTRVYTVLRRPSGGAHPDAHIGAGGPLLPVADAMASGRNAKRG